MYLLGHKKPGEGWKPPRNGGTALGCWELTCLRKVSTQRVHVQTWDQQTQFQSPPTLWCWSYVCHFHCPPGFQTNACSTNGLRSSVKIELLGLNLNLRKQNLQQWDLGLWIFIKPLRSFCCEPKFGTIVQQQRSLVFCLMVFGVFHLC